MISAEVELATILVGAARQVLAERLRGKSERTEQGKPSSKGRRPPVDGGLLRGIDGELEGSQVADETQSLSADHERSVDWLKALSSEIGPGQENWLRDLEVVPDTGRALRLRQRTAEEKPAGAISPSDAQVAGALALDPDAVFVDARRRLELVFRINVGVSLLIAFILIATLAAAITLGLEGHSVLAAAFGGASLLDVIGAAVYKPLAQINRSLVYTQRLDIVHLATRERLHLSAKIVDPGERMRATEAIWKQIRDDLDSLSGGEKA